MAQPQHARIQTIEEIAVILATAVLFRQPISAIYNGHRRSLCPYILGYKRNGGMQVLCYQYSGGSASGLRAPGSPENWRCVALGKLRGVHLLNDDWVSAPSHTRKQSCIDEVIFDTERLADGIPGRFYQATS